MSADISGLQVLMNDLSGELEAKKAAAITLKDLTCDKITREQLIHVLDIRTLVHLLTIEDVELQWAASMIITNLASSLKMQDTIGNERAFLCLLKLLESTEEKLRWGGASAIASLVYKHVINQECFAAVNGIEPLVRLYVESTGITQANTANAINSLVSSEDAIQVPSSIKNIDEKFMFSLVYLLKRVPPMTAEKAFLRTEALLRLLLKLTKQNSSNSEYYSAHDGIYILMDILNNDDALLPEVVLLTLLELLNSLVYYSVENSEAIIGRNGIMVLARALTRGEFAQYNHVSSVLQLMGELVLAVSDTKDEIREQHLIPVVVEMISSTKQATRIQAGQLLSVISGKNEKNCIAICQNAGIEGLVDLMIEQSMEARKYATCAIANITEMIPDMDAYLNKCRGIERLIVRLMDDDEATAIAVANALIELIKTKSGIKRLVYQNGGAQLFGYMLTQPKITFHRLAILGLESLEGVCEESIISDDANLDKAELTTINSEDLIYNAENLLGRGGFSEVLQGQWLGAPVAVKRYINTVKQERVKACEREAEILEQLRHPYILTYYGACAVESLLVTQFIERGSLYRVLHESEDQLSESWNLRIAIQIAQGLRYIHSKNFIHCDVKSANILLDHGDVPLFCDFGLSMLRTAMFMRSKEGVRGTPPWSAPESFSGIYTQACDVFSLGVLFYEIKARRKPSVLEFSILGARPAIPETTRQPFLALISQCWDRMPHNRPTMARVIEELTTHR